MRERSWIFVAVLIGLASPAAGHQSGGAECNGALPAGPMVSWALDAEACCTPPGYCLSPGCCEHSRRCCDNAWAGYCEHRAKVEAFWARVGVPKPHGRPAACRQAPMAPCAPCSTPAVQPTPAVLPPSTSPLPPPAPPEKATRKESHPACAK